MMGTFLLGLVVGVNLAWVFMSLRRGSNPPPPSRKSAPTAMPPAPPPDVAAAINRQLDRDIAIARRKRGLSPWGWGPGQLNPPPPAPGMRREWLWSPFQMADCGGPCWEARDPRCCDCGALWRDVLAAPPAGPPKQPLVAQPIWFWAWEDEQVQRAAAGQSQTQRSNGNSKPTMPNPPAKPQPHGGRQIPSWL